MLLKVSFSFQWNNEQWEILLQIVIVSTGTLPLLLNNHMTHHIKASNNNILKRYSTEKLGISTSMDLLDLTAPQMERVWKDFHLQT